MPTRVAARWSANGASSVRSSRIAMRAATTASGQAIETAATAPAASTATAMKTLGQAIGWNAPAATRARARSSNWSAACRRLTACRRL